MGGPKPATGDARERADAPLAAPAEEILVVDDNRANLVAIQAALLGLGARVVTAESGAAALRRLLDRDFALILLDVQMPTMDGFETARLVRARQRSRHTPIIFVTAHSRDNADVLQAYQLGAVDFLFKPIVPEVLRAKASVFLELHRRTLEVTQHAEQLREHQRREHELELAEARRAWIEESLRAQMDNERKAAAQAARRAEQLVATVAELERAESELVRMNRALAESDQRKDEFLAVLAHELRNPLAPIVNSLEVLKLLLRETPSPSLQRAALSIERQTHHLTRLVDDLLDLSRINSGKIELRTERVALEDVVSQAVALSQPWIDQRQHELRIHMLDSELTLRADAVRLSQIIANLLNNAARYTEPGGLIELTCRRNDSRASISVSDSGRGIPAHLVDKVFDMFVQEQAGGGGLGIGLSLVQRLVELHGGTVRAESAGVDQGTQFIVELPLGSESVQPPPPDAPAPHDEARRLLVAVVDDNADVRETLSELLRGWGHEVLQAADGKAGVELILSRVPDVALVDLGLPLLDGYELARAVRAQEGAVRTRLVAVSGFGRDADRRRALSAGFDLHLVKPAAADTLLHALALGGAARRGAPSPA